jgi:Arc/MetJ-type ribon-helix-helix transcriptional regulator
MRASPFQYRLPPQKRVEIEERIDRGEYSSISEFITEAISMHLRYLEERDFRIYILQEKRQKK